MVWCLRFLIVAGLAATVASALSVYPHQLAYFNEIAGGPQNGHGHLLHSNLDWGQDLLFVSSLARTSEHLPADDILVLSQVKYDLSVLGMTPLVSTDLDRIQSSGRRCLVLVDRMCLSGGSWDKSKLAEQVARQGMPIPFAQFPVHTFRAFLFDTDPPESLKGK